MLQPLAEGFAYVFDNDNAHSREQHRCLAEAYDPVTLERLAGTGVTTGWRCLEIGSGGGTVARWLADRVAPTGEVVATDIKPRHIAGRPGLVVLPHDVTTDPLPEAAFDLVVARLVLQHLPERLAVLDKLVAALKPGGWLQIDEFDTSYEPPLLTPDAPATELYETFLRTKCAVMRAAGGDPEWGRRAPAAMRAAGLVDIDPQPCIEVRHAGAASLQLALHHTYHLQDRLIAAGMTARQLDEVRALMRDPSFRAASSVFYSVQGRRPREDGHADTPGRRRQPEGVQR
ncbi:class I SAM-dependent methyltransferase [Streptomyces sp. HMX87]|uniref:class I SAM-dependent methyltransferase n=1 Tax=Streptomyces sp. HMX87 TaxID=3390849 RepID=UPI003A885458